MGTSFFELNNLVHVALGTIALLGGLVALASRKGARFHVRGGWTFSIAMIFVILTTLLAMLHEFLPLAIILALATVYLIPSALLSVRHEGRHFVLANSLLMLLAGLLFLFTATQFLRINLQAETFFAGPGVLAIMFGFLLWQDIHMLRSRPLERNAWLRRHFTRMILAFTIAVMALVRIGINFGLSLEASVILPLAIAAGFIFYIYRLYPTENRAAPEQPAPME